jgi:hypothetical protein
MLMKIFQTNGFGGRIRVIANPYGYCCPDPHISSGATFGYDDTNSMCYGCAVGAVSIGVRTQPVIDEYCGTCTCYGCASGKGTEANIWCDDEFHTYYGVNNDTAFTDERSRLRRGDQMCR